MRIGQEPEVLERWVVRQKAGRRSAETTKEEMAKKRERE